MIIDENGKDISTEHYSAYYCDNCKKYQEVITKFESGDEFTTNCLVCNKLLDSYSHDDL